MVYKINKIGLCKYVANVTTSFTFFFFSGHYMSMGNSAGIDRDYATSVSPILHNTSSTCHMSFSYYVSKASGAGDILFILYKNTKI